MSIERGVIGHISGVPICSVRRLMGNKMPQVRRGARLVCLQEIRSMTVDWLLWRRRIISSSTLKLPSPS